MIVLIIISIILCRNSSKVTACHSSHSISAENIVVISPFQTIIYKYIFIFMILQYVTYFSNKKRLLLQTFFWLPLSGSNRRQRG